jgi:putative transposase
MKHETGVKTADLCSEHGINTATLCGWKQNCGGLDLSEMRLKVLEDETLLPKWLVLSRVWCQHSETNWSVQNDAPAAEAVAPISFR